MNVHGVPYRSIALADDGWSVDVIDQTRLPHEFEVINLTTLEQAAQAIETMIVRGAPLIGATAAYGVCLAVRDDATDESLAGACARLARTRPTAVNLRWALEAMQETLTPRPESDRADAAYALAGRICEEDVATNRAIAETRISMAL